MVTCMRTKKKKCISKFSIIINNALIIMNDLKINSDNVIEVLLGNCKS